MTRIAAGLEGAFAARGFSEPSVGDLRDAAGVSLRTLYKYVPSRDDMVQAALEHRHARYLSHVFDDLPDAPDVALAEIFARVGLWMQTEASHGCLFHAAVAAAPDSAPLRALLERHKGEVAQRAAAAAGLPGQEVAVMLLIEGLTQSWPLRGDDAVAAAQRMGACLQG
ncbi:TetR/AcrR family transcriptional regulator [Lutimaribacter marinistellae]|uniref:TetR/AcrR family transcriptional regulator n=1 Tax=Lutimaribacter marinistellae TaxID=1820329 RepID=A0ABV7TJX2_9RHOB